jgi:hypothetical protein
VSYAGNGTVYSFRPGSPGGAITRLEPVATASRPGMVAVLPTSDWRVNREALRQPSRHYVSLDGSTFVPA